MYPIEEEEANYQCFKFKDKQEQNNWTVIFLSTFVKS